MTSRGTACSILLVSVALVLFQAQDSLSARQEKQTGESLEVEASIISDGGFAVSAKGRSSETTAAPISPSDKCSHTCTGGAVCCIGGRAGKTAKCLGGVNADCTDKSDEGRRTTERRNSRTMPGSMQAPGMQFNPEVDLETNLMGAHTVAGVLDRDTQQKLLEVQKFRGATLPDGLVTNLHEVASIQGSRTPLNFLVPRLKRRFHSQASAIDEAVSKGREKWENEAEVNDGMVLAVNSDIAGLNQKFQGGPGEFRLQDNFATGWAIMEEFKDLVEEGPPKAQMYKGAFLNLLKSERGKEYLQKHALTIRLLFDNDRFVEGWLNQAGARK